MIRLGKKVFSSVLASLAALSLAACGGGSHGSALPVAAHPTGTISPDSLVPATFTINIPAPKSSSKARKLAYISAATKSIRINMTADSAGVAIVSQFNVLTQVTNGTGNAPGSPCTGSGPWTCTVSVQVPPGNDTFTFTTYDDTTGTGTGASHILSQQVQTLTLVTGKANAFTVTFDANVNTMTVSTTSGFCAGSFTVAGGNNVPTVGTSTLTFNAGYTDLASKTIVGPGLPQLSVNGHTDTNAGGGYNDPATGGTINVKVTQSTQSFTVQPSSSSVSSANVAVAVSPPGSDGLSFSKTLSFTVSSGSAPPSGLLAAVEQTNTSPAAGQVDLFTMTNPSDPTGFNAFNPATIVPAGSPSKDVDNPQDLTFDTNGDLLIANGGAGSPDFGNFACIPAGVITATTPSASSVTILTTHMDDPISLALGTDSSVALANLPATPPAGTPHLVEFLLSGTYAEAGTGREVTQSDVSGLGALNVVALPTTGANPAGTFAVGMSNGANPPSGNACSAGQTPNSSEVVIKRSDGTTATINDNNTTVVEPLVGYDANASVLVIAASGACNNLSSNTGSTAFLDTWSVGASPAQISSQVINDAGGSPDSSYFTFPAGAGGGIAVSASGYVAVAGASSYFPGSGIQGPEVWVFKPGAGTRTVDDGPIPFNAVTTASGTKTYAYGTPGQMFVTSLRFLGTSNKLLIGFQSNNASFQGFYLYDVANTSVPGPATAGQPCTSTTCYTGASRAAVGKSPTFVAFQQTTNHPLAAAYKP